MPRRKLRGRPTRFKTYKLSNEQYQTLCDIRDSLDWHYYEYDVKRTLDDIINIKMYTTPQRKMLQRLRKDYIEYLRTTKIKKNDRT